MAGTDYSKREPGLDGPITVLVEPQMGENIGAAARGMWNFGLSRMRIVAPRDGWPNSAAVAMASGAGRVLDEAQLHDTTAEAVADCQMVYATTARPREMTKRVLTPEEAMAEASGLIFGGKRVAILYGAERAGLANADVVLANTIISVPVNPAFASLNLAQCVLLISYEWRRAAGAGLADDPTPLATSVDVGRMVGHLAQELDTAGFFFPPDKRASMLASLENVFRRAPLTDADVRTLWGVIKALATGPKRVGNVIADPALLPDMGALRVAIDKLDRVLLSRLAERKGLIERAAELKSANGWPARIPDRVEEVVTRVRGGAAEAGLDPDLMEDIWRRLIDHAIALEEELLAR